MDNLFLKEVIPSPHKEIFQLEKALNQVLLGKPDVVRLMVASILAQGHILLDDVPGTGKTTIAKSLAIALGADFKRIQFTPDLLPGDILGGPIWDPKNVEFKMIPGPLFAQVVLADEINRASPRTQSALLEAMEENQVSLDGQVYPLPEFFLVIATENPIGFTGTHPLPEAQLDRFLVRLSIGYPDQEQEMALLKRENLLKSDEFKISKILSLDKIREFRKAVRAIGVHDDLVQYLLNLGHKTRNHTQITLGLSPRGLLSIQRLAKAFAWIEGGEFVQPEHIQKAFFHAGTHRISVQGESFRAVEFINDCIQNVPIPR